MKNRRLYFEKIKNIRDLGGLTTSDGHSIVPSRLFRSANLSEATASDVYKLEKEYHLTKIVDLRTNMEQSEKPDAVIATAEHLSNPIFDESVIGISHEKSTHQKQNKIQIPVMEDLYRMMVTNEICRKNFGMAAKSVMEHDFSKGSVLWHCTEGKDRCGLLTVVLLSALGVDRQQIMEDYLITNEVNEPKAQMYYQQMILLGKSEAEAEAIKNAFLVKETYLNAAFSAIDEQYHDMETYLTKGLHIPEEVIMAFREKVLC